MESSEASLSGKCPVTPRAPRISPTLPLPSVQNLVTRFNSGPISPEMVLPVQSTPPTLWTSNAQDSPTYLQKDSPLKMEKMPVRIHTPPQEIPIWTPRISPNESFSEETQNRSVLKEESLGDNKSASTESCGQPPLHRREARGQRTGSDVPVASTSLCIDNYLCVSPVVQLSESFAETKPSLLQNLLQGRLQAGMACILCFLLVAAATVYTLRSSSAWPSNVPTSELGPCTAKQIRHGCAAGFCSGSGQCRCEPQLTQTGHASCANPMAHKGMQFYVYRALDNRGINQGPLAERLMGKADDLMGKAESLQGVLWYLHNHVLTKSCPRSLNVTRVARYKATVFNTDTPFEKWEGQFGPYVDFNNGKGTQTTRRFGIRSMFDSFGYVVGCMPWEGYMGGASYGNKTQGYSFPGACPLKAVADKTEACRRQEPGGYCSQPDGTRECTWNLQPAGEISLDELADIKDYQSFCANGGLEYDKQWDRGIQCTFWNGATSPAENAAREEKLRRLFSEKYPNTNLPEPTCDNRNRQCQYHEGCGSLPGNCCPADNGMMLSCCRPKPKLLTAEQIRRHSQPAFMLAM